MSLLRFRMANVILRLHRAGITKVAGALSRVRGTGGTSRHRLHVESVQKSSLFDAQWYLRTYPDVARAGVDPLAHYLNRGWQEGRDPGPEFATSAYLKANPDVARSGINPLVHYIKFGHAEGRGIFGPRPSALDAPAMSFEFASPAPCASFPLSEEPSVSWRRSYRLDSASSDAVIIADWVVGYARDTSIRTTCQAAFELLEQLSGFGQRVPVLAVAELPQALDGLADAWYLNSAQVRTRWTAYSFPLVVRAYQHDPLQSGRIFLAGEGRVSSPLDFVDIDLKNAYFPVLFVFSEPTGNLRGVQMLAFPSLCRGGIHYPELIRLSNRDAAEVAVDPISVSRQLAARLKCVFDREGGAAVTDIAVDLSGADGTGAMFQPDFQRWLEKVARVTVTANTTAVGTIDSRFLAEAVTVNPSVARLGERGTLILRHDMAPTISAITEPRAESADARSHISLPLLIAAREPSQPALWIEIPSTAADALEEAPLDSPLRWPRLEAANQISVSSDIPAGAILLARASRPSDAELFAPDGDRQLARLADMRQRITWLIDTQGGENGELGRTLTTLALQTGRSGDRVIFVGPVDRDIVLRAKAQFDGVSQFNRIGPAVATVQTPLAGFVGAGVLLHDNDTASIFSCLLQSDSIATASCPLICFEQAGKVWHVTVADAGAVVSRTAKLLQPSQCARVAEELWGSHYPVAVPSPHLWASRSSDFATWFDGTRPTEQNDRVHICTTVVTASYVGAREAPHQLAAVPQMPADSVTQAEVLFG